MRERKKRGRSKLNQKNARRRVMAARMFFR